MLTNDQKTTLKDHILNNTNPDVVNALATRNDTELARLYNLETNKFAWRTNILPDEYRAVLDWTEVDNISANKARVWEWATLGQTAPLNASNPNLRQGIAQAFGGNSTTTNNLTALAKRNISVYEDVFAEGVGNENNPATLVVEGVLDIDVLGKILNA